MATHIKPFILYQNVRVIAVTIFEVVLQGIRNFKPLTRFSFKPGLNIIQGNNSSGKTTLLESLVATFYGPAWHHTQTLLPKDPSVPCQAGIVLKSNNGGIFRITRDFTRHRQALSKLDQSRKFVLIEKEEEKIFEFVKQELRGLQGNDIENTSTLRRVNLPSLRSQLFKKINSPSSRKESPTIPEATHSATTAGEMDNAISGNQKVHRLTELKQMQKKAEEGAQIEERLNEYRDIVSDLNRRIKLWSEKNEEVKALKDKESFFPEFSEIPSDLDQLIQAYEQTEIDQRPLIQELDVEKTALLDSLVDLPENNILQNKFLWAGGSIMIIMMIIGLAISLDGLLRHLFPLGLITGIGFIVWSIVQDRQIASKRTAVHDQIDQLYKKQEEQEQNFQKTHESFFNILKKTGCKDSQELREKSRMVENICRSRKDLEEQLKGLLQEKHPEDLEQELKKALGEVEKYEKQFKDFGDVPSDIYSIQDEIRKLEGNDPMDQTLVTEQLDMTQLAPPPEPYPGSALPVSPENTETRDPSMDLSLPLTTSFYDKVAPLNSDTLKETATTLFKKLAPHHQWEFLLSQEGSVSLKDSDRSPLSWESISSGSLDLIWLTFFLSGQGLLKDKHPFPMLLDDPLIGIDPMGQSGVLDILRTLSRPRQIFLSTSRSLPIKEGDHQIQL